MMDDAGFVEATRRTCDQLGNKAVALIVGSQAAGFADEFSDLDVWILGDKDKLPENQREAYEHLGMFTNDSFGGGRHWIFYDVQDMIGKLEAWPNEKMWSLATSQYLHGCSETAEDLKRRYAQYPREIAERKTKWLFGKLWQLIHNREIIARKRPVSALLNVTQTIECLARICCTAECRPWPYDKWLVAYARETRLGTTVFPLIDNAVSGLDQAIHPPAGVEWRELTPAAELGATWEIVQKGLKDLGWDASWIENWWEALADTFDRPAP